MTVKPATERRVLYYQRNGCNPRDWLNFVQLDPFPPAWKDLGLDDEDDLRSLEMAIMVWPDKPPVVPGTGGLRKIRFAPEGSGKGKSGAVRVYYAYFPEFGLVTLIFAHSKDDMESISDQQKREIKRLITEVQQYLEGKKRGTRA